MKKKISPEEKERRRRIGYNFKRLREAAGFKTQQALADHLELRSRNYIGKIEAGHSPFAGRAERRFAKFFNVDISEFLKPIPGRNGNELELAELQRVAKELSPSLLKKLIRMGLVLKEGEEDDGSGTRNIEDSADKKAGKRVA